MKGVKLLRIWSKQRYVHGCTWEVGATGVLAEVAETVTATGESTIEVGAGCTVPKSVEVSRPKRRLSSFGPCRRLCLKGPCGIIFRRDERKKKECGGERE